MSFDGGLKFGAITLSVVMNRNQFLFVLKNLTVKSLILKNRASAQS